MTDSILTHPEDWEELYRAATAANSRIEAMRLVRDASIRLGHPMTLKECKAYVDQLEKKRRPGEQQIEKALELLKQARMECEASNDANALGIFGIEGQLLHLLTNLRTTD